jgi:5'-deoxynucleotidase YfbR-like HD superfamily hydrolase
MATTSALILHLPAGEEIEELWREYEEGQTPAAQLVKDFDKVLQSSSCVAPPFEHPTKTA